MDKRRMYSFNGRMMTVDEIAEELGVHRNTIYKRMQAGMTPEEAIAMKTRRSVQYDFEGRKMNLNQIAAKTGISYSTLDDRMKRGMTLAEAIDAQKYMLSKQAIRRAAERRAKREKARRKGAERIALLLMREIFNGCRPEDAGFRRLPGEKEAYAFEGCILEYRAVIEDKRARLMAILRETGSVCRIWEYEICGDTIARCGA